MSFYYLFDGQTIPILEFLKYEESGLLSSADVVFVRSEDQVKLNCVGFAVSRFSETLAIFPKHYALDTSVTLEDFAPVFNAIQLSASNARVGKWGAAESSCGDPDIAANYPFGAFHKILTHYRQFGLHFLEDRIQSPDKGRVNWKLTSSKSSYYLVNNNLTLFPLIRECKVRMSHILTDAMVFAINYTASIFGGLLNLSSVPYSTSIKDDPASYDLLLSKLRRLRTRTFNDRLIALLDALLAFYSGLNHGSGYYYKSRNFSLVWQDAVGKFMRDRFSGVNSSDELLFASFVRSDERFQNLVVKQFNSAMPLQSIDIDHFWFDKDSQTQYIFDAKYYNDIRELNYKQVFYTLVRVLDFKMQGVRTVSALILPSETFASRTHFILADAYSNQMEIQDPSLKVLEFYCDCRKVLTHYQARVISQ